MHFMQDFVLASVHCSQSTVAGSESQSEHVVSFSLKKPTSHVSHLLGPRIEQLSQLSTVHVPSRHLFAALSSQKLLLHASHLVGPSALQVSQSWTRHVASIHLFVDLSSQKPDLHASQVAGCPSHVSQSPTWQVRSKHLPSVSTRKPALDVRQVSSSEHSIQVTEAGSASQSPQVVSSFKKNPVLHVSHLVGPRISQLSH